MSNLGISDLAAVFGKSPATIKRRLRAGDWHEAQKVETETGERWEVRESDLGAIAAREEWPLIDLTGSDEPPVTHSTDVLEVIRSTHSSEVERLTGQVLEAVRRTEAAETELANVIREHKTEIEANQTKIIDLTASHAEATALAEERSRAIDRQQAELETKSEEIAQAHLERRELTERLEFERLGWWAKRRQSRSERS